MSRYTSANALPHPCGIWWHCQECHVLAEWPQTMIMFLDLDFKPLGLLHESSKKFINLKQKEEFKVGECYRIIRNKSNVTKLSNPWESSIVEEVTQVIATMGRFHQHVLREKILKV